jgi:hypothetical protein
MLLFLQSCLKSQDTSINLEHFALQDIGFAIEAGRQSTFVVGLEGMFLKLKVWTYSLQWEEHTRLHAAMAYRLEHLQSCYRQRRHFDPFKGVI